MAIGGALVLLALARAGSGARGLPAARWAVADRDACAVLLLDEDLLPLGQRLLPWPIAVRSGPTGHVWVAFQPAGHEAAEVHVGLLELAGDLAPRAVLAELLDFEAGPEARALVLGRERAGANVVLVLEPAGQVRRLEVPAAARSVAMDARGNLLLALGPGGLLLVDAQDRRRSGRLEGAEVFEVAGRAGRGWWARTREQGSGAPGLVWLDRALEPRARLATGPGRLAAAHPRLDVAWLVDGAGGRAWSFKEPRQGARRVRLGCVDALAEGSVRPGGGLLLATVGALEAYSARGLPEPGHGRAQRLSGAPALLAPPDRRASVRPEP